MTAEGEPTTNRSPAESEDEGSEVGAESAKDVDRPPDGEDDPMGAPEEEVGDDEGFGDDFDDFEEGEEVEGDDFDDFGEAEAEETVRIEQPVQPADPLADLVRVFHN